MTLTLLAMDADALLRAGGRLHPVLVHFPIALLISAAAVEFLALVRKKPGFASPTTTMIVLGALAAIAAAGSGWLNGDHEPHGQAVATLLFRHRWLGVSAAALSTLLAIWVVSTPATSSRGIKTAVLLALAPLVGLTGHLGGSMVYGEDYFFEPFRADDRPPSPEKGIAKPAAFELPAGTVVDFAKDIKPIFDDRCISCHGPDKQKGNLRLDKRSYAFAGTEDTWPIQPGSADKSDLVRRIELPSSDDDHMPPKDPALTPRQIALIRAWINQNANWPE